MKRILTVCISVLVLLLAILLLGVRSSDHADAPHMQEAAGNTTGGTTVLPQESRPQQETQMETAVPTTQPPTTAPTEPLPPEPLFVPEEGALACRDYFVYDYQSQTLVSFSSDPEQIVYPASITKLFTAYVALQCVDAQTVITAGDELAMVAADSSIAYVRRGHRLTAAMLVQGMLMPSGNDAAYVLAAAAGRACGGEDLSAEEAVARFVEEMNAQAEALGLTGTHFVNPDGYHDDDHYTTALDLITIARLALENPWIREYAATSSANVTYASGHTNTWRNTNQLINPESSYYCPDAIGLKTGNTGAAGYCLLSAFQREGRTILIGVFGCPTYNDRFADSQKLYEWTLDALE